MISKNCYNQKSLVVTLPKWTVGLGIDEDCLEQLQHCCSAVSLARRSSQLHWSVQHSMAVAPGSQRSLLSNKNNKNAEGTHMFFYAACLHVIIVYICSGGQDPPTPWPVHGLRP